MNSHSPTLSPSHLPSLTVGTIFTIILHFFVYEKYPFVRIFMSSTREIKMNVSVSTEGLRKWVHVGLQGRDRPFPGTGREAMGSGKVGGRGWLLWWKF